MNDHQQLQEKIRLSGLKGEITKGIWARMNAEGLQAALESLEEARQVATDDHYRDDLTPGFGFRIWGEENIEPGAIEQMKRATQLPVAVAAALMGDSHPGYGLPIGGVLATDGAVLPYGVGVDVGCSIHLSRFAMSKDYLNAQRDFLKEVLINNTRFGINANWKDRPADHPVLDDPRWNTTPLLRSLKDKARQQLGSSGGGNHFVEWGYIKYGAFERLAILSHSGSRGVGAQICTHYTEIAKKKHPGLQGEMANLAWLDMSSEAGQEYWISMELAGDFATANHAIIHDRMAQAIGLEIVDQIGSRHNFAWREQLEDYPVIMHRKGATPAYDDQAGVIPSTLTHPTYIIRGKGNYNSLYSASHGAGRRMSRREALKTISQADMDRELNRAGVELIGGSLDEAPQAYKNPSAVMAAQSDLVDVDGYFFPVIAVMAEGGQSED